MNPKHARMIAKLALGLAFSAVIGYTMKAEKMIENRIDDYFYSKEGPDN